MESIDFVAEPATATLAESVCRDCNDREAKAQAVREAMGRLQDAGVLDGQSAQNRRTARRSLELVEATEVGGVVQGRLQAAGKPGLRLRHSQLGQAQPPEPQRYARLQGSGAALPPLVVMRST